MLRFLCGPVIDRIQPPVGGAGGAASASSFSGRPPVARMERAKSQLWDELDNEQEAEQRKHSEQERGHLIEKGLFTHRANIERFTAQAQIARAEAKRFARSKNTLAARAQLTKALRAEEGAQRQQVQLSKLQRVALTIDTAQASRESKETLAALAPHLKQAVKELGTTDDVQDLYDDLAEGMDGAEERQDMVSAPIGNKKNEVSDAELDQELANMVLEDEETDLEQLSASLPPVSRLLPQSSAQAPGGGGATLAPVRRPGAKVAVHVQ